MTRLWLTAVVLLCACGAPPPSAPEVFYSACDPVLLIPQDASPEELASLDTAIGLWREVGLTAFSTTATDAGAQVPVRFKDAPAPFHGVYEAGVAFVNKKLAGSERDITVAHELGHALGLPHVSKEERPSLMNPGNLTVPPSTADIDDLRRQWGCP
jgi:hypothetical protein